MRRVASFVGLGGLLVTMSVAGPARAEPLAEGPLCGLVAVSDPTFPGSHFGVLEGGPVALVDTDPAILHFGHLTCEIHVGSGNGTHGAPYAVRSSGPDEPTVAYLSPGPVSYYAGWWEDVYVCASVTFDGWNTWYYDDPGNAVVNGTWTTSPAAHCTRVIHVALKQDLVDPTLCQFLRIRYPPDGDIRAGSTVIWDCPPYSTDTSADVDVSTIPLKFP